MGGRSNPAPSSSSPPPSPQAFPHHSTTTSSSTDRPALTHPFCRCFSQPHQTHPSRPTLPFSRAVLAFTDSLRSALALSLSSCRHLPIYPVFLPVAFLHYAETPRPCSASTCTNAFSCISSPTSARFPIHSVQSTLQLQRGTCLPAARDPAASDVGVSSLGLGHLCPLLLLVLLCARLSSRAGCCPLCACCRWTAVDRQLCALGWSCVSEGRRGLVSLRAAIASCHCGRACSQSICRRRRRVADGRQLARCVRKDEMCVCHVRRCATASVCVWRARLQLLTTAAIERST